MKSQKTVPKFAICIQNEDCEDLEVRKIYQVLPDEAAAKENYLRIIDESGEDYLYPSEYFVLLKLPLAAKKAFALSAAPNANASDMPQS